MPPKPTGNQPYGIMLPENDGLQHSLDPKNYPPGGHNLGQVGPQSNPAQDGQAVAEAIRDMTLVQDYSSSTYEDLTNSVKAVEPKVPYSEFAKKGQG